MSHIHQEIQVDAPIEHVFEFACQVDRQREWNPYIDLFNVSGPINVVGTTFDSHLNLVGQCISSKGAVVEVEPQRLIHIRVIEHRGASEWFYRFEPSGAGTRCSLDIEYEKEGMFGGVIDRLLFHGALDRAARHMAENFAALAEQKVATPV